MDALNLLAKKKQAVFRRGVDFSPIRVENIKADLRAVFGLVTMRDFKKYAGQAGSGIDKEAFISYLNLLASESGILPAAEKACKQYKDFETKKKGATLYPVGALYIVIADCANELFPNGDDYGKTLQGVLPNRYRQIGKRLGPRGHSGEEYGAEADSLVYDVPGTRLLFLESDKYKGVALTVPMQKVLSMLHEELCRKLPADLEELGRVELNDLGKYTRVKISLDRYLELTGTKDKKTARATIREACDRLFSLYYLTRIRGVEYRGRLFESQVAALGKGVFEMEYTTSYLRYCATTSPAAFHRGMYKINGKQNPYSWGIGQKLWQHFMQTRGESGNGRLKVSNILADVPDIPTYDEVMATDRHFNKRIIEPFERDLEGLIALGVVKSWEYCNAKGLPLEARQLKNMDFDTWAALYVSYELNLPPQDKYIEAHKKRIAAAMMKHAEKIGESK